MRQLQIFVFALAAGAAGGSLGANCVLDSYKTDAKCQRFKVSTFSIPSTHATQIARLLAPTLNVTLSGDSSPLAHARCNFLLVRDPRDVVCALVRKHGGDGFSPVALETKVKHWSRRLFNSTSFLNVKNLEESGGQMLRYECLKECLASNIVHGGLSTRPIVGGHELRPEVDDTSETRSHHCMTDRSHELFWAEAGVGQAHGFLARSGYSKKLEAPSCGPAPPLAPPLEPPPLTSITTMASDEGRAGHVDRAGHDGPVASLARFKARVGGLKVTGVDARFAAVMKGSKGPRDRDSSSRDSRDSMKRCSRAGCLPVNPCEVHF